MDSMHLLQDLSDQHRSLFKKRQSLLTFDGFIERLAQAPRPLIRNSPSYLHDMFKYFGVREIGAPAPGVHERFKLFDRQEGRCGPIVGGEGVQKEIHRAFSSFVRQGFSNKLILLHGPNGSAKSTTVEAIARGMQAYSMVEGGAVYTFNWIFPVERGTGPAMKGETGPIGFAYRSGSDEVLGDSYALLDETQIACKIPSEFKDNPIYLIPMPQREKWLREWIGAQEGIPPEEVNLPPHVLISGLSKRNYQILENLLAGYDGDLGKVFRHVQVERFFYSRQYRVGISTVEPQMSIDGHEKQLTMDSNLANLPTILQNIRMHEAFGQLVEANRGILEFSDMLKRPIEAFKYLLSAVETGALNLPTSTANLDVVFLATTNEKHLDAFKTTPDFTSFRERFELITVPYLVNPSQEEAIYARDREIIGVSHKIAPHTFRCLCVWAVMTRLKKPDPENYESKHRPLIARLSPRDKVHLIEGIPLSNAFNAKEAAILRDLREKIMTESTGTVVYEGRFGASPREVRAILYRAAHNREHETLTPMTIFEELRRLVKDRTVYEFLQFEPRGKYHDAVQFIKDVEADFARDFENEVLASMSLVEDQEYEQLIRRYIDHVVAEVKKEMIVNPNTGAREPANQSFMADIEKVMGVTGSAQRHREELIGRVAAFRLENPSATLEINRIFSDILEKIQRHYYEEKRKSIDENFHCMLMLDAEKDGKLTDKQRRLAEETYKNLEQRFGYDRISARESLKFIVNFKKQDGQ